ncbi:odorant receptor 94b-like [Chelonus insularis]|uniref:odorant receptor 94b-like n=1 Tax=Chelonus insularis TaxID=460826 RepID=UPI00158E5D61|nr:odorant receptor 94b-like [Chelonus insularis]
MVVFKLYVFRFKNKKIRRLTEAVYRPLDFLQQLPEVYKLKVCYKSHHYLYKVISELNSIFSSTMLVQISTGCCIICLSCFQLVTSNIVSDGTWSSGWERNLNSQMKSFMLMSTVIAKYPLQIEAGCFFIISLDTFVTSVMVDGSLQSEINFHFLEGAYEHVKDDLIAHRLRVQFRKHRYLVGAVSEFNSIFNLTMLMQVFTGCFMICLGSLQILIGELKTQLTILFFLGAAGFQLFSCCWFGSELIFVSNSVTGGLWSSSWEENLTFNVKSTMMIALALAKNPLQIKAGKFFIMSLETFVVILKSAYSFFVLLSSVNEE